jgi:hypothetical protein
VLYNFQSVSGFDKVWSYKSYIGLFYPKLKRWLSVFSHICIKNHIFFALVVFGPRCLVPGEKGFIYKRWLNLDMFKKRKRSQVHGFPLKAGFKVRDKAKIEDPKPSQKMLVLPHHCQIPCSRFVGMWERSIFPYKTFTKCHKVMRMHPLNR